MLIHYSMQDKAKYLCIKQCITRPHFLSLIPGLQLHYPSFPQSIEPGKG
jgi:hypothetical protein